MRFHLLILALLYSTVLSANELYKFNRALNVKKLGFSIKIFKDDNFRVSLLDNESTTSLFSSTVWRKVKIENINDDSNFYEWFWVTEEEWLRFTLGDSIDTVEGVEKINDMTACSDLVESDSPYTPRVSLRPVKRPPTTPQESKFWAWPLESPYSLTLDLRESIIHLDYNECLNQLWEFGDMMLGATEWKNTTIKERAELIHGLSKKVFSETTQAATMTGKNEPTPGKPFATYVNAHYIDPLISPELMSCIAFQETRGGGGLNPLIYNYTFCNETQTSTAFGLGAITESTINGMINYDGGRNLMPWLRTENIGLRNNKDFRSVHQSMMYNPGTQLEAMLYILNEKIKFKRKNNLNKSDADILDLGIVHYDQDHQGPYLNNVKACMACLKNNQPAYSCYKKHIYPN